jgi:hypothetical protein
MEYSWTIRYKDFLEYKRHMKDKAHTDLIRKYIREMAIAERAYYEGFKPAKERVMFKEEIEDVEKVYGSVIASTNNSIKEILPSLLHYMEEFVNLHGKKDVMEEKLAVLKAKLGKGDKEESEDE